MIFTERQITIRNGKSSIDAPVVLYRGDFEVSIRFTIMESKFRFKSGVNLVDSEKASFGQLAILAPYGGNVFSDVVKCEDGTVTFTLTKTMIDQLEEVGLYSFQIRLFDYYRESRVSIPPVEFGIEVREPVASEDHDNEVNNAIVGYSIAKVVDPSKEDVGDTFDANGNYNKTDWETGDRITEGKLNKIEDAIDTVNKNEIANKNSLNKQMTSNFNVLSSEIDTKASADEVKQLTSTVNKKADTTYVDSKVKAVASGSPKGTYATVAALQSAIPKGDTNIYVVTADGGWYYWNGSAWTKGGTYQSSGIASKSINYSHLDDNTQILARTSGQTHVLPPIIPANRPWINVDTGNKEIIIYEDTSGMSAAFSRTTLEKHSYGGAPYGEIRVSYSHCSSSAVHLYYDMSNKVYFAQNYSTPVPDNSVFVMMFRTHGGVGPYSSRPTDVLFNGKPDSVLCTRIDEVLWNSGRLHKSLICTNHEGYSNLIIWDPVNKEITINAPAEFMYKNTLIAVSSNKTIKYTTDSSFVAFGYHTFTHEWAVHPYSDLDDLRDFVVYDLVRTYHREMESLFTNNIFFKGVSTFHYINPYELKYFDKSYRFNYIHSGKSACEYSVDTENIQSTLREEANPTRQVAIMHNRPHSANMYCDTIRFTKRDNVACMRLTLSNSKFKFYWAVRASKVNNPEIDGSIIAVKSYGPSSGQTLNVNVARYLADVKRKYNLDAVFVTAQIMKVDESIITEEELKEISIHVDIVKHATTTSDYESLENTLDITKPIVKSGVNTRAPRIMFKDPIYAGPNQVIMMGIDKRIIEYNGNTVSVYAGLHGYNENEGHVYDANWQIGTIENTTEDNFYYEYNVFTHWYQKYSTYPCTNIPKIHHYYIYIGFMGDADISYTLDDVKAMCELFTIKFQVRDLTEVEKVELLDHPEIVSRLTQQAIMQGFEGEDDANDSIHMVNEQLFTANASGLSTCVIPARAKGYIVEFRGKVSGGEGFIQFSDSYDRMSLVDTKYRTYKMRFNKLDDISKSISVDVTVPSGGSLTIRNLKVIPQYDEVPSTHANKSSFYLHRGYSSAYPENSLLAVEEACKRGCSVIEVDIYTSVDNKAIISHDASLGRTNKDRPTITFTNTEQFSRQAGDKIWVDSAILDEFRVHDYLTVTDNDVTRYVTVYGISGNILTLNSSVLTGPISKISNGRRTCYSCTEAEFMEYEIGAYKNDKFAGEYNRPFDDYIRVVSRYEAALLLDMRSLSKECFTNHVAPLLDRYNYWDKCYFMHGESACDNYHSWAGEIGRKIVIMPITYATGDDLTALLNRYGSKEHPHALRKDIAISQECITKEHMDLAHSYGIRVHTFSVNSIATAQKLLRMGVDIIGGDHYSDDTAILW